MPEHQCAVAAGDGAVEALYKRLNALDGRAAVLLIASGATIWRAVLGAAGTRFGNDGRGAGVKVFQFGLSVCFRQGIDGLPLGLP
ncbi:hypothetical protein WQE_34116 [Paraburkholderia hospita]|uniref:Uncharacterized protein n=1 Tax=Paraburkholderia hospita TaxID=169430 RepID=A0ABP2PFB5_9BURK|nr:hypothetical protein WQE_34116 [Paraburkholderia hospita]